MVKKENAKKVENSFALFEKNRYICSVHAESVRGTTYGKKLVEALCFILVFENLGNFQATQEWHGSFSRIAWVCCLFSYVAGLFLGPSDKSVKQHAVPRFL